jgi:hypothetical protein
VTAVVSELRSALPKPSAESRSLEREIRGVCREMNVTVRIEKLNRCATALVAEFEKISHDQSLGSARSLLQSALAYVTSELSRLAAENGLT